MKEYILTQEERNVVRSFHPFAAPDPKTNKMILTPLQCIPDEHARLLCYWSDHMPFMGTNKEEWIIKRETDRITVSHNNKSHSYWIDTQNGNVGVYNGCKYSDLGTNVYVSQFYILNNYLFPIFFGPGHRAHGRNAVELGEAVVDSSPLNELLLSLYNKDREAIDLWYFDKQLQNINLNNPEVYNAEYIQLKSQLSIAV